MNISQYNPEKMELHFLIEKNFSEYLKNYRVWTLVEGWMNGSVFLDSSEIQWGFPGYGVSSSSVIWFRVLEAKPAWNKFTGKQEDFLGEMVDWHLKIPINEMFGHYKFIPYPGFNKSWSDFVVNPFEDHKLRWVLSYLKKALLKSSLGEDFHILYYCAQDTAI